MKKEKIAIVVGGTSGIGLEVCKSLCKKSFVVLVIGRNKVKLTELPDSIKHLIEFYPCDITDWVEFEKVSKIIHAKYSHIDCLVNCQGESISQEKGNKDISIFEKLLRINLSSVFYSCALFSGLMANGGSVVNVSSVRGRTGTDTGSIGYAAAKAGVINLTKSFAFELAVKGIKVNCVAPGPVYPTGISANWSKELRASMLHSIPLSRIAKPKEVAYSIVNLLCYEKNITGCTLDINGGLWTN